MTELVWFPTRLRVAPITPERLRRVFGEHSSPDTFTASYASIDVCREMELQSGEVRFGLLHFDRIIPEEATVAEILVHDCLPRIFADMVDFVEAYPDVLQFPIIPVGSKLVNIGHAGYACAWGRKGSFSLTLLGNVQKWADNCRFLVSSRS